MPPFLLSLTGKGRQRLSFLQTALRQFFRCPQSFHQQSLLSCFPLYEHLVSSPGRYYHSRTHRTITLFSRPQKWKGEGGNGECGICLTRREQSLKRITIQRSMRSHCCVSTWESQVWADLGLREGVKTHQARAVFHWSIKDE